MYTLEGVAVLQTSLLLMKSFNKTEAPFLSPAFSKKSGGTLFSAFPWCVVRGAWCVVRGAWCVVRGSEFLVGTLSP